MLNRHSCFYNNRDFIYYLHVSSLSLFFCSLYSYVLLSFLVSLLQNLCFSPSFYRISRLPKKARYVIQRHLIQNSPLRKTFISVHMILDMLTLTRTLTFSIWFLKFSKFFWFWFFKNLMLYIWPLIYLFVLGRDGWSKSI